MNLATIGSAILALFITFGFAPQDSDPYPGHPPIDNAAAAIKCSPPDAPPGTHWEYEVECTAEAAEAHEQAWRGAHTQYQNSCDALEEMIRGEYAALDEMVTAANQAPPDELADWDQAIARQRSVILGLEGARGLLDSVWILTQAQLAQDFYVSILDCCVIVED